MADEEWVRVATEDDSMVAELLVQLKQVAAAPPPPQQPAKPALSLEWSVRQRRSRAVLVLAVKTAGQRASPTTPLSWSGATSASGGASFDGGAEEQSGVRSVAKRFDASRSKVIGCEAEASNSRKPKRKKTLIELREEEELLDRERRHLHREVAAARRKLEKESARNAKLKRIKMEVQAFRAEEIRATPSQYPVTTSLQPAVASNEEHKEFVLPDLNIPIEDSSSCDVSMCGARFG